MIRVIFRRYVWFLQPLEPQFYCLISLLAKRTYATLLYNTIPTNVIQLCHLTPLLGLA